jgi:hypothetical protein
LKEVTFNGATNSQIFTIDGVNTGDTSLIVCADILRERVAILFYASETDREARTLKVHDGCTARKFKLTGRGEEDIWHTHTRCIISTSTEQSVEFIGYPLTADTICGALVTT